MMAKKKTNIRIAKSLIILGSIIILVTTCIFISTVKVVDNNTFTLTQILDHYGSFTGGIVGVFITLASVFYLIETLKEQRKSTEISNKTYQYERFDSTFFNLIKLLDSSIKELKIRQNSFGICELNNEAKIPNMYEGEKALIEIYKKIVNRFNYHEDPTSHEVFKEEYIELFDGATKSKIIIDTYVAIINLLESNKKLDLEPHFIIFRAKLNQIKKVITVLTIVLHQKKHKKTIKFLVKNNIIEKNILETPMLKRIIKKQD